jgi:hypothetical protein
MTTAFFLTHTNIIFVMVVCQYFAILVTIKKCFPTGFVMKSLIFRLGKGDEFVGKGKNPINPISKVYHSKKTAKSKSISDKKFVGLTRLVTQGFFTK